jgi:HAE1 family hydrophobic/amphiphilic exporter-1
MLVGLLGKNAILIVEFAVQRREEGLSLKEAAIEGGKLRFRPIQMTSFAFIAGLIPLVIATGAGAIGNRTIGTTGVGGMLLGTVVGVLVIPGLYFIFASLSDGKKLLRDETSTPLSEQWEHEHLLPADELPADETAPAEETANGEAPRGTSRGGATSEVETAGEEIPGNPSEDEGSKG